jgi:hypothetical protein
MARAKRFYLCNLIPLWEIDDEHLEVDWAQDEARAGDFVELRVVVRDLTVDPRAADLAVRLEINESDFLLFGGLNDHIVTISSRPSDEDDVEHRPLLALDAGQGPPANQRLRHIFVSPPQDGQRRPGALVRAYWQAVWRDDVSGDPEYYFDATVTVGDGEYEERSDRELVIRRTGERFGPGLLAPPAPSVVAAGWSTGLAKPGQEVELLAVIHGGMLGQRVSFEIYPDGGLGGSPLERFDLDLRRERTLRARWRVPDLIPLQDVDALRFEVAVADQPFAARDTADLPELPGVGLHGRLKLRPALELRLVDAAGRALARLPYRLLTAGPEPVEVARGTTDQSGRILVEGLSEARYVIDLEGVAFLDAQEPEPATPAPGTENVVFSFLDVRLPRGA